MQKIFRCCFFLLIQSQTYLACSNPENLESYSGKICSSSVNLKQASTEIICPAPEDTAVEFTDQEDKMAFKNRLL